MLCPARQSMPLLSVSEHAGQHRLCVPCVPTTIPTTLASDVTVVQGDGWRGEAVLRGSVLIAATPGATATVEAAWVADQAGSLSVPHLWLKDVPHEEVFDVGARSDYVNVLPA